MPRETEFIRLISSLLLFNVRTHLSLVNEKEQLYDEMVSFGWKILLYHYVLLVKTHLRNSFILDFDREVFLVN